MLNPILLLNKNSCAVPSSLLFNGDGQTQGTAHINLRIFSVSGYQTNPETYYVIK
jgi:hypothetical protein